MKSVRIRPSPTRFNLVEFCSIDDIVINRVLFFLMAKISKQIMSKFYSGSRSIDGLNVFFEDEPLDTYQHLYCFSTGGFEWGYEGNAPRQLAFAMLMHHLNDAELAVSLAPELNRRIVSILENEWTLSPEKLEAFISECGQEIFAPGANGRVANSERQQ